MGVLIPLCFGSGNSESVLPVKVDKSMPLNFDGPVCFVTPDAIWDISEVLSETPANSWILVFM